MKINYKLLAQEWFDVGIRVNENYLFLQQFYTFFIDLTVDVWQVMR